MSGVLVLIYTLLLRYATPLGYWLPLGALNEEIKLPHPNADPTNAHSAKTVINTLPLAIPLLSYG
jgi:hypothetical protein